MLWLIGVYAVYRKQALPSLAKAICETYWETQCHFITGCYISLTSVTFCFWIMSHVHKVCLYFEGHRKHNYWVWSTTHSSLLSWLTTCLKLALWRLHWQYFRWAAMNEAFTAIRGCKQTFGVLVRGAGTQPVANELARQLAKLAYS